MGLLTPVGTLAVGAVFGLALAAPPGPMNAVIAEESVLRGWVAGFTAGLGAMTADLVFFALSLVGLVAVLQEAPALRAAMVGVGGILMLYFAYGAATEALATSDESTSDDETTGETTVANGGFTGGETMPDESSTTGERSFAGDAGVADGPDALADLPEARGFRKALILALTNPYQILFWLTVGVGLLQPGTVDVLSHVPAVGAALAGTLVVQTGSPALLVGLFLGIGVWIVGFPALLVSVGRRVDAFAPTVAALSALVLAGFGVVFCWTAASSLLAV